MAGLALAAAACFMNGVTVKFENRSSYAVRISPNMASWAPFTLNPGESKDIESEYDTISFYYDQQDLVFLEWVDTKHVVFRDRPVTSLSGR
jgi:flagellar basal body-associated protein FliL